MSLAVNSQISVPGDAPLVRILLLNDREGKALVLVPANMLLNLVSIWKHSGRHLQPIRGSDAVKFLVSRRYRALKGKRNYFLCRCSSMNR